MTPGRNPINITPWAVEGRRFEVLKTTVKSALYESEWYKTGGNAMYCKIYGRLANLAWDHRGKKINVH